VPFAQIALAAYVPHNYPIDTVEPGLNETAFYDPTNFTCCAGAHIAEVEIDRDTGTVTLLNFTAADDFGRIINPLIVAGHNGRVCLSTRGMRLHRLALLQPRRGGSIGIVAISVHATGAPAFAAASSGGKLGSQCTARKRCPVTPPAASDTSQLSGGAMTAGWIISARS
jgi:hypothetical protein